ncbi:hemagglutinin repeat-containing protein [uncultured Veillonella sp.]|uniref:two-partner secretion domain-containing protein n=1 Tax=uncultured Veillonella sp. TaxID=159268 RepID=UPI002804B3A3|nr:hemagglutinin repeat-containing protein [uncultured Veillonella sp.]
MNIRKQTAMAIFAALLATNSAPWIPMALANPVVPDQGKLGPKIEEARNGMTVVNINTPNDKGLSHNQYNAFNVDEKGLILNNANRPVNTELAGYIMGNPNLVGPTANTILNEVTGTSSTSMNGALEVAGDKAHVIVANPNGISVNNGTFINASSATLTTGNPIINNGSVTGYNVQKGVITVGEKGLNASKTARTDMLAEAVKLNGKVWAQDAQVVTGKNDISVDATGKVTNTHKTGESSQVGLDVAAIGGMYANSMYLVGTNDGFGVNNQGVLSAQNKLTIDSTGKLQNTGTIAATDANITTKSLEQMNKGKLYVDTAKITTDSVIQTGNATTKEAPVMIAQKDLSIATKSIVNTDGSVIKAEGKLQLGKTMDEKGTVSGKMDSVVNTASTIEFGQGGALLAKSVDNKNSGITLKRVAVEGKEHVKNEVAPSGSIKRYQLSEERIYGHDDEIPKDKVVVHSSENLQLSINGKHHDSWTKYEYDRTREEDVVDTSNPGRIISGGNLHVDVDHMVNEASQISAAGDITGTVGHYEQSNPKGNEYITEEGTATSYSRHHKKGWDTTNIREAKYKNTKVNPKDVPVAVYGGHVENSKSDVTVDASLLNSMSQLSTNPNTSYVIETDPNFTNRRNFLSSDYVLSRLKLDPMNIQKRLGDGYYEQQLVMQEIMRQTGKSRLQSGLSAEEQYRQLMDAGISVTKSQSIVLGRGLTEAEQKNLKEDVVLLVSKSVVLPNGKTETVLVPTLYLAPTTKRVEGGANLQAQSINLSVDTMHNSGSIVADKDVTLTGTTIQNNNGLIKGNTATVTANDEVRNTQGTIMGNDRVSVYAKKDIINEGGTITQTNAAGSTKVSAGRDVINKGVQYEAGNSKVEWNSSNNRRETITGVDQGHIGGAGQTTVVAGRDVSMEAGIISSDVNTTVTAGRNVTIKAMNATHELEEHRFDKGKSGGGHSQTTQSHDLVKAQSSVGSSIEGKNVSVLASNAVQLEGSQVLAADTVKVSGNTVALNTAKANSTVNHVYLDKKKSLVKRESTNAADDVTSTAVTGSTVSGKDITITSAQDVTGQSAQILGENAVSVTAGGKVELGADKAVTDGSSVYRHKKSGVLGGAGIGFSIGKEKHNIDEANHEEATMRNTIASTKGAVNIKANDTVHLTSADIVAKEGAVLDGSAVTLDGNVDHNHMTHDERYKKTGLTVSLGGAIANTLTNTTRTIKQAGGRDDKRLAALELNEARKQLQDGYEAVDAALHGEKIRDAVTGKVDKVDGKAKRGAKNIDDAINLSVSIGSTSRKQGQVVDTNTYQGGSLVSDGNVHIKARDAQKTGIGLTGETVEAKKLVLDSASDINLEAGKNTVDVNNTYKSSGWSVGAGISLTGAGLLDINASGHMARQNGDTHQESYVPTKIKAAQLAQLKAKRDTNIIGSTVSAKKVEVDTGRDLHIQSLQDVDNFKEHSKSAGFSVSSKPNFKNPTGSINASVGRIDSKWKSVTEQAGIYAGEGGYDVNVGNNTTLEGAVIKSDAPKAKNKLTTKSLEMKDIKNEAEYTYSNNGIGYNYYGSKKKLEEMKTKDKKGYDKIYNNIGLVPNLGVGSKGKASSTTQSAISDGILTVDGKEIDTKTINTNTENTLHQLDKIFDKKKIEERQELARLFSKNAFEQLHNWQPTTKDGKIAKSIAHGIIGEVAARMAGNSPGSGFKATMTNEMLISEINKVAKHDPAVAQWLSAAVGGVVNKASGENANAGSAVASYATKWNEDLVWNSGVSNTISSLASVGKGAYGLAKNASPALIAGNLVSTPLVTGTGEPTTYDENTMANIPGTAFYRSSISAPVGSGEVLVASTETDVGTVYNGPWVKTETYPGTSLKVQLDYNLDSGFQPINVYHSPDGNTYQDNGKHDVINRRFFDGISIPGSTIYTGRFIGTDGTDNWIASQDKFKDPYIHIVNINSGETAILPYTKGDISIIDDPTDSIIRNPNTGRLESIKTGLPVSVNVADQFKTKFNPISESFESSSITVLEANKYQDKSKADTLLKDNIEKGIDKLNKKSPKPSKDDLAKIGIGVTVLDKAKNQIKEIFSSLKQLKNLPEGYKMIERKFIKMKNDSLGEQLRDEVGGSWRKVYEEGIDINGRRIKIHYFMNDAGEIFNPKIKQIDGLKNLDIPLR